MIVPKRCIASPQVRNGNDLRLENYAVLSQFNLVHFSTLFEFQTKAPTLTLAVEMFRLNHQALHQKTSPGHYRTVGSLPFMCVCQQNTPVPSRKENPFPFRMAIPHCVWPILPKPYNNMYPHTDSATPVRNISNV